MYTLFNLIFDSDSRFSNLVHVLAGYMYRHDHYGALIKVGSVYRRRLLDAKSRPDIYTSTVLRLLSTAYLLRGDMLERIAVEADIQSLPEEYLGDVARLESQDRETFARLIAGNVRKSLRESRKIEKQLEQMRRDYAQSTSKYVNDSPDVSELNDDGISYAIQSNLLTSGYGHELLHEYKKSHECYSRALSLSKSVAGHRSLQSAIFMSMLAGTKAKMGEAEEALSLIETAISIRERFLDRGSLLLASTYLTRADVYLARTDLDRASRDLERVFQVYSRLDKKGGLVDMPYLYETRAELAFARGDYNLCWQMTEESIQGYRRYFSRSHPVLLSILSLRLRTLECLGIDAGRLDIEKEIKEIVIYNDLRKTFFRSGEVRVA